MQRKKSWLCYQCVYKNNVKSRDDYLSNELKNKNIHGLSVSPKLTSDKKKNYTLVELI